MIKKIENESGANAIIIEFVDEVDDKALQKAIGYLAAMALELSGGEIQLTRARGCS